MALEAARTSDRPTLIAARTTIGFGAPTKAGTNKAHGSPLGAEEIAGARKFFGWDSPPFEVPADILADWRAAGQSSSDKRTAWRKRLAAADAGQPRRVRAAHRRPLPAAFDAAITEYKKKLAADKPKVATRKSSEMALEVINGVVPETIGGSADLTGSNNTKTTQTKPIAAGSYGNRYVHYGIREHGMAAAMSGLSLHGGIIPYGGTFLCFSDYARPAMRLASLMGIRSIYVMTHDSIGLGEDGPTHQPVEHLAALRAIPNHLVFRPADATEAAECWQLALQSTKTPSTLALTRQNLAAVRTEFVAENLCARGAYELAKATGKAEVTIFASGSEVEIALGARSCSRAAAIRPASSRCRASNCSSSRAPTIEGDDRDRAGEGGHRSRHPPGLGSLHRHRRDFRRHDRLRRQRARSSNSTRISASPPKLRPRPPRRAVRSRRPRSRTAPRQRADGHSRRLMRSIGLIHRSGGWILRASAAMKRRIEFRPSRPGRQE